MAKTTATARTTKLVLDAGIKEVTLMEDRARVIRRGAVKLKAGVTSLSIDSVSPLISDKTLVGRVTTGDGAEVVTATVAREHREKAELQEDDPERIRKDLDTVAHNINAIGELRTQANQDLAALNELEGKALAEMAYDASWAMSDPGAWEQDLNAVDEKIAEIHGLIGGWARDMEGLQLEQRELERRLAAASSVTGEYNFRIEALVQAAAAGEYTLEFEYVVPSACWRPSHVATLKRTGTGKKGGETLEIRAEGCVWQNTGEDWAGVQLWFSTQRPSLGIEPPELGEDLLTVQKKPDHVVVEVRDQVIEDAGQGQGPVPGQAADEEMPGIDDGGEALNLRATSPADIPSDGRPYRVEIFSLETAVQSNLVCMPELTRAVIHKTSQTNTSKSPLLAGPVDLIRESGKIGNAVIPYVAPGEAFDIGWGPDPELRVQRWQIDGETDSKAHSSWEETRKTTTIALSNIGGETRNLVLKERIPVSEIEAVKIRFDRDSTTEKVQPDENGFIEWQVTLGPFGRGSYESAYVLRKKKAVTGV